MYTRTECVQSSHLRCRLADEASRTSSLFRANLRSPAAAASDAALRLSNPVMADPGGMGWAPGPSPCHPDPKQQICRSEGGSMTITIAATEVAKPKATLIEAFRNAPTSVISDNLARLAGCVGLR